MRKVLLIFAAVIIISIAVGVGLASSNNGTNFTQKYGPRSSWTILVERVNGFTATYHVYNTVTTIGKELCDNFLQLGSDDLSTNDIAENGIIYISLSSSSSSPDAGWTILPSEITANGLERAEGTDTWLSETSFQVYHKFNVTGSVSNLQLGGLNWDATSDTDHNLWCAVTFTVIPSLADGDNVSATATVSWP